MNFEGKMGLFKGTLGCCMLGGSADIVSLLHGGRGGGVVALGQAGSPASTPGTGARAVVSHFLPGPARSGG